MYYMMLSVSVVLLGAVFAFNKIYQKIYGKRQRPCRDWLENQYFRKAKSEDILLQSNLNLASFQQKSVKKVTQHRKNKRRPYLYRM